MTLALEMRGITKRFPGVTANEQVDFQLSTGEIHALLGENGAGKTTLMHILYGLSRPDEGDILVHGVPVRLTSPRDAMACGIGMVHQHFMLVPALTVTENIILGQEPAGRWPFLVVPQAAQHIRQLAAQYHLDVEPQALIQDLPIGLRQRVEILKALYRQATILILDEPTAVLTPGEAERLFETLATLAQHGTSIIFITHKLREVFRIAQRLTVLRRGRVVGTLTPAETTAPQLAALMVGETHPTQIVQHVHAVSEQVVLDVRDIDVRDDHGTLAVAAVSLAVRAGEILGIAGVQGNGQTELIEALAGLRHPVAGSIVLQGVDVTRATPRQLAACGVAHIPEDRHKHGMVELYTIADNLVLNTYHQQPFAHRMVRRVAAVVAHAVSLMQAFDIRAPHPGVPAGSLSGGNQQKMVIARECSHPLTLLLAAQPTRGLDIAATAFIHQHLVRQRDQGCAVVLVSADLDELLTLADRIAVMYGGKILASVAAHEASRETLGPLMAGVPMPQAW
ncbi:MAG TPA: ABC transporter ATP-binding protein [Candidatus Tectomicrobia bacterium]